MSDIDWSLKNKWFMFIPDEEEMKEGGFITEFEGTRCCGCDPPYFKENDIIHKDILDNHSNIYFSREDIDILRQKLIEDIIGNKDIDAKTTTNIIIDIINKRFGVE